jgi:hypothetical protein
MPTPPLMLPHPRAEKPLDTDTLDDLQAFTTISSSTFRNCVVPEIMETHLRPPLPSRQCPFQNHCFCQCLLSVGSHQLRTIAGERR